MHELMKMQQYGTVVCTRAYTLLARGKALKCKIYIHKTFVNDVKKCRQPMHRLNQSNDKCGLHVNCRGSAPARCALTHSRVIELDLELDASA